MSKGNKIGQEKLREQMILLEDYVSTRLHPVVAKLQKQNKKLTAQIKDLQEKQESLHHQNQEAQAI